jgi:predicted hydrocarbon binding protein
MNDRKVRGSVINGYLKFVEKTWGKEGLEKCLSDTKLKGIELRDGGKYPNSMLLEVILWISRNYGMEYVRKAGRHTVKNLGLLAYIVRFTSIETMLGKAKDAYAETYDFGEVSMKISGKHAIASMKDVSEIPENCEGWIGALEALLEITRTKGTVRKTKCQLKGDPRCEYEVIWE